MSRPTVVHWFRQDLRLGDHPSWCAAVADAQARGAHLLAVAVWDPAQAEATAWSPVRCGPWRQAWLADSLAALDADLRAQGQQLLVLRGQPHEVLPRCMTAVHGVALHAETWPAPEEQAEERALRAASMASMASTASATSSDTATGWRWHTHAPSVLLPLDTLPWPVTGMPDGYTPMRQAVEAAQARQGDPWPQPIQAPADLPPPPPAARWQDLPLGGPAPRLSLHSDPRSSFPFRGAPQTEHATAASTSPEASFSAGEAGAQAHLQRYLAQGHAEHYKATRNKLTGLTYSSKWSPWLAVGAISAPQLMQAVRAHEAAQGASDGSYWLWFELLWREHFRLLQHKHGAALYRWRGLSDAPAARERLRRPAEASLGQRHADAQRQQAAAERWRQGQTGQPLVDAAMRELSATGYLSNRLRQVAASWLVHDLGVDWRVGAAWFESLLIDFDVHSNQGNWLYLAGLGTDPRGGRRFDPVKQAREHDPDGHFQRLWGTRT